MAYALIALASVAAVTALLPAGAAPPQTQSNAGHTLVKRHSESDFENGDDNHGGQNGGGMGQGRPPGGPPRGHNNRNGTQIGNPHRQNQNGNRGSQHQGQSGSCSMDRRNNGSRSREEGDRRHQRSAQADDDVSVGSPAQPSPSNMIVHRQSSEHANLNSGQTNAIKYEGMEVKNNQAASTQADRGTDGTDYEQQ